MRSEEINKKNMQNYLLVFIGSGIGGVIRYSIGEILKKNSFQLPINTLISNLIACLLIGFVLGKYQNENSLKLFIAIGICGGMSTFSTFSAENIKFIQMNDWYSFMIYSLISFIACLSCTWIGLYIYDKI